MIIPRLSGSQALKKWTGTNWRQRDQKYSKNIQKWHGSHVSVHTSILSSQIIEAHSPHYGPTGNLTALATISTSPTWGIFRSQILPTVKRELSEKQEHHNFWRIKSSHFSKVFTNGDSVDMNNSPIQNCFFQFKSHQLLLALTIGEPSKNRSTLTRWNTKR